MRHLLLAAAMAALLSSGATSVAAAPTAAQATPVVFEAASVKPHGGLATGSYVGRQPGGRLAAAAATLRELIEFAYEIQPFQLLNDRKWIDEERWDISAKLADVPAAPSRGQADTLLLALRSLLADRFQLVVRKETRQLPIYAIVLARGDGRLGPQLTRSAIDCAALRAAREKGDTTPLPAGAQACGAQGRIGSIQMRGSPLSDFAARLAERLHRTVVDRTGLTGAWDLSLTYTPDPEQIVTAVAQGVQPQFDPNGPSFFTAVQEQLGLKVEAATGPVEVLIVERADRARPD